MRHSALYVLLVLLLMQLLVKLAVSFVLLENIVMLVPVSVYLVRMAVLVAQGLLFAINARLNVYDKVRVRL